MTITIPEQAPRRVLLVQESPRDTMRVRQALGGGAGGLELVRVAALPASAHAAAVGADCALLDVDTAAGFEALETLRAAVPSLPVVILTGGSGAAGAEAVKRGADDYVLKTDLGSRLLRQVVEFAIERRLTRSALRRSESYARDVLSALGEGVLVHDRAGRLVRANAAALALLGPALDDPSGEAARAGWRVVRPDGSHVDSHDLPGVTTLRTGTALDCVPLGVVRPDGTVTWVEVTSQMLAGDADGEPHGVVSSYRDVTRRYEAERAIRFQAALLDAAGQAIVASDASGGVVHWNRAAAAMFALDGDEANGRPVDEVLGVSWTAEQERARAERLAAGEPWTAETALARGGPRYAALTFTTVRGPDGDTAATIVVCSDVTERTLAQDEMLRLSAIVSSTADAVFGTTTDGVVTSWNEAAERLLGYTAAEMIGRRVDVLVGTGDTDDTELLLRSIARGEPVKNVETVRTRKDGERLALSVTVSPVRDSTGAIVGSSTIARDMTDRNRLLGELRHSALHDALTGLPNRTLLADRLEQAGARADRTGGTVAVLFVDIDHFKIVNDAAGHEVGDRVLVEVASRIARAVRAEDTVARFGGDEFVVVCGDGSVGTASYAAERILAALREPVEVGDQRLHVTASIGIAIAPPTDLDSLLSSADAAMYDAKARGRSRVRVFDETLAQEAATRLELSGDLRDALADDELALWYQPIVDLATGALIGLEALARWDHPRRGPLLPSQFVGLAEEVGLSGALDRWALRHAAKDIAALRSVGAVPADAFVSVNVSARSLRDASLERVVLDAVAAEKLPPGSVVLELTETGLMDDPDSARDLLVRLRDSGVGVAIDDFGTGYSSLAYLGRFSVATLKVDRSFVERMLDSHDDLAIVAAINDLARAVGVRTVAEGIENEEQARLLRRLGCHAGQGFLWSGAVPPADVAALVARQPRGRFPVPGGPASRADRRGDDELSGLTAVHGFTRMLALHRDGASPTTIAAALNAEDFRTPRGNRWHRMTVTRALHAAFSPLAGA